MMSGGSGGRIFNGERRLRPYTNQSLKCPRCDSLNTKFCYYNNYNLSQPRHFCKSCRRYWTKGGILRNVPVGGGCRKTKRSKPDPSLEIHKAKRTSNSRSISTENASPIAMATEVASSSSADGLLNLPDSRLIFSDPANTNPNFEPSMLETLEQASDGGITSLMTMSNLPTLGLNLSGISPFRFHQQQQQIELQQHKMTSMIDELKMQECTARCVDQTVPVDLPGFQNRTSNGELTALDWKTTEDQGWFDLPSIVDQGYWSQSQLTDIDHSFDLP